MPIRFFIFAHRHNPDGTCETICSRCFQTIATVRDEAEFPTIEREHVCNPLLLERFERLNFQRGLCGMNRGQFR